MLMGLELPCGTQMMEQPKTCWEPIATSSQQTDQISGISSVTSGQSKDLDYFAR